MRVTEEVAKAKEKFVRAYLTKNTKATAQEVRAALIKHFSKLPKAARGMKPQTIGTIKSEMAKAQRARPTTAMRTPAARWPKTAPGPCVLPFRDKRERIMLDDLLSRLAESGLVRLKIDHVGDGYAVVVRA